MIQSQQYSPFIQRPVSPSIAHNILASNMNGNSDSNLQQQQQQQQSVQQPSAFEATQFGNVFSHMNGANINNSADSSISSSPPHNSSPPSFNSLGNSQTSHSASNLPNLNQSTSSIAHSVSTSSFFPAGSFPFSSQYNQNLNSISNNNPGTSNGVSNQSQQSLSSLHMSGNPPQQQNSNGMVSAPPSATSNFFPNSISSFMEDKSTTHQVSNTTNSLIALRVSNLPRDIQIREFNVLFTFAPDFIYSELHKSSGVAEDGLPTSVIGIGYFKTLQAASNAMSVLSLNPLIFAPKDIFSRPNASTSPYSIKCDIRGGGNSRTSDPSMRLPGFRSNSVSAPRNQPFTQPNNSTSPLGLIPQQGQQVPGSLKSIPSRFMFTGNVNGNVPQLDMPPQNFGDIYGDSGVLSPTGGMFSPTSPRALFPTDPEFMGSRMSGKSLLLESQGKEDEEYNNMVKAPMGWFSRNSTYGAPSSPGNGNPGPVGFSANGISTQASNSQQQSTSTPSQQQTQQTQQSNIQQEHSPKQQSNDQSSPSSAQQATGSSSQNKESGQKAPSPTSAPSQNSFKQSNRQSSSSVSAAQAAHTAGAAANAWTDKRRGSAIRFQNLSISGNTNSKNPGNESNGKAGTSSPFSPTNGASTGNGALSVIPGTNRVLPPANPADQNPPCNTLYVGNLPPDTNEEELKKLFSAHQGYKRLCFRTKANGPMCFVEFEDVSYASQALDNLYGVTLSNSVKGGIRLSYSKNPLGVRSQPAQSGNSNNSQSSANSSAPGGQGNPSRMSISGPVTNAAANGFSNNHRASFVNELK